MEMTSWLAESSKACSKGLFSNSHSADFVGILKAWRFDFAGTPFFKGLPTGAMGASHRRAGHIGGTFLINSRLSLS
jgi:hypothetical protein